MTVMVETHRCSKCKQTLPLDAFHQSARKTGHQYYCKACLSEYQKAWRERRQAERPRTSPQRPRVIRKRGREVLSPQRREELFLLLRTITEKQKGLCPICQRELGPKPVLDREVATERIRGLLCPACRLGLEGFGDDPQRLRRAAKYLEGR